MSLDSQRWVLSSDLKYGNLTNKKEAHATWEFKNCNFSKVFGIGLFQLLMEQNSQNLVDL